MQPCTVCFPRAALTLTGLQVNQSPAGVCALANPPSGPCPSSETVWVLVSSFIFYIFNMRLTNSPTLFDLHWSHDCPHRELDVQSCLRAVLPLCTTTSQFCYLIISCPHGDTDRSLGRKSYTDVPGGGAVTKRLISNFEMPLTCC